MLGQVDAATATLQHALTASRLTLELQTQLGVYLAETGRARDAVRRLEPLATARGPQAPVHLLNALGIAYARAGNPERALATFQALVEQDPACYDQVVKALGAVGLSNRGTDTGTGSLEPAHRASSGLIPEERRVPGGRASSCLRLEGLRTTVGMASSPAGAGASGL